MDKSRVLMYETNKKSNYSEIKDTPCENCLCDGLDRIHRGNGRGVSSYPFWYVIVGLMSILCYVNNLYGDFVHDDVKAIKANPDVRGDTSVLEMFRNDFWGKPMSDITSHKSYRPLCVLSFRFVSYFQSLIFSMKLLDK